MNTAGLWKIHNFRLIAVSSCEHCGWSQGRSCVRLRRSKFTTASSQLFLYVVNFVLFLFACLCIAQYTLLQVVRPSVCQSPFIVALKRLNISNRFVCTTWRTSYSSFLRTEWRFVSLKMHVNVIFSVERNDISHASLWGCLQYDQSTCSITARLQPTGYSYVMVVDITVVRNSNIYRSRK